jgi:hypothetical protein
MMGALNLFEIARLVAVFPTPVGPSRIIRVLPFNANDLFY